MNSKNMSHYLKPNWPAAKNVHSFTTLRHNGYSKAPFAAFNLGFNTEDDPAHVAKNRALLQSELNLKHEPFWLEQKHSNLVVLATSENLSKPICADAAFTTKPNLACVILTADCIPILLCDKEATIVAAAHAGWRGIASGIIENTIASMQVASSKILAWLGPAIGPEKFVVNSDMREQFVKQNPNAACAFKEYQDRWLADIYTLAKQRLTACGVTAIYGGNRCTYSEPELFFSYRRDQGKTGRNASLIWLT
ncbi:MAG: peptidoglycan editing factor PgeF [Gammaproteobacteria bacterium]|nr:peptidoglycan editing factor PgeF [Gammaproteobacteria bacterium]